MKKHVFNIILYAAATLAIVVIATYFIHFRHAQISDDSATWGTLGDYMGGVIGTIFGFVSMILIYLTFQRQQEISVLQQFETTFFNLLAIQREMMKSVNGSFDKKYDGQDFFEQMAILLETDYVFFPDMGSKEEIRTLICDYYAKRFDAAGATLGPYYRHLYHFIKYTNSSLIYGQKKKYMDIIQSQMSDAELYCLFYNAICYGSDKLLPKLDNYSFLENIERKTLVFDKHKRLFFPQTKFKYDTKEVPLSDIN